MKDKSRRGACEDVGDQNSSRVILGDNNHMHSHDPRSEFLEREVVYHGRGLGCKFRKLLGGEDAALWLRNCGCSESTCVELLLEGSVQPCGL